MRKRLANKVAFHSFCWWILPLLFLNPQVLVANAPTLRSATQVYEQTYNVPPKDESLKAALGSAKIAFIRGLFGNVGHSLGVLSYFDDQIQWLHALGIQADLIPVNTQGPKKENSGIIHDYLSTQNPPIFVVAHSKGGIDLLEALVQFPSSRSKVAGIITIQSPFQGTEAAQHILEKPLFKVLYGLGISATGGGLDTIAELTPKLRMEYHEKNTTVIAEISSQIPWINVRSMIHGDVSWILSRRKNDLDALKIPSDGLVPTQRMLVPAAGIHDILLNGIDHLDPIDQNSRCCHKQDFNRRRFLKSLLWILTNKTLET